MGYGYAIDPGTGALIWRTKVGVHNGHDNDGELALRHALRVPSQYTVEPGIVGGVETNMAVADGVVYVPVANLASQWSAKAGLGKANFGAGRAIARGRRAACATSRRACGTPCAGGTRRCSG